MPLGSFNTPSAVVDYGTDLSCVTDLDPGLAEINVTSGASGTGTLLIAQANARRLTTPRGGLIDDPHYGLDLRAYIGDDLSPADIGRIAAQIDLELAKDERNLSSTTTLTFTGNILTVTSLIVGASGPFTQVVSISALTTTLLTAPQ